VEETCEVGMIFRRTLEAHRVRKSVSERSCVDETPILFDPAPHNSQSQNPWVTGEGFSGGRKTLWSNILDVNEQSVEIQAILPYLRKSWVKNVNKLKE